MNTIDVTAQNPASILILEAMCAKSDKSDMLEMFGIAPNAQVQVSMQVNGIEVDVVQAFADAWKRLEGDFDQCVTNKAKELLSLTKFDALARVIERAEREIEETLKNSLQE